MESYHLVGTLSWWAFILWEYDFDIGFIVGRVNENVNGLSYNPSSNKEDMEAHWHGI
jgi:hypothetical protein